MLIESKSSFRATDLACDNVMSFSNLDCRGFCALMEKAVEVAKVPQIKKVKRK